MSTATYKSAIDVISAKYDARIDDLEKQASDLLDKYCSEDGSRIPDWPDTDTYEQYKALDSEWKATVAERKREMDEAAELISQ